MLENLENKTILEIENAVEVCVSEILKHKSEYIDKKSRLFFESLRTKKEKFEKILESMQITNKSMAIANLTNNNGVAINYTSIKDWLFDFMFFLIRSKNSTKSSLSEIISNQMKQLNVVCD
jgi:hypothetical protein